MCFITLAEVVRADPHQNLSSRHHALYSAFEMIASASHGAHRSTADPGRSFEVEAKARAGHPRLRGYRMRVSYWLTRYGS